MSHHIVNIPVDDEISLDQTPLVEEATTDEKQEARKVDNHLIEVKETNVQRKVDISCIKSTTILFKVHVGLRESNRHAYMPKTISIGPYHKKNPQLRSMEKYKLLYLQRFLKRKEGINEEICIKELEKLKDEALKCYDDVKDNTGQFLQLLLVDGCFVVEFIRERCKMIPSGEDKIINRTYMRHRLRRDLLLLENQLPFFVLTMLHQMTMDENEGSLLKLVKQAFRFWIPENSPEIVHEKHINHLLQIVHSMSCQSLKREISDDEPSCCENHLLQIVHSMSCQRLKKEISDDKPPMMPNATELSEAGVRFSKVENRHKSMTENNLGDSRNLLEIKFTKGLMEIPYLVVGDDTETILRNLIAYEQQFACKELRYFSEYVTLMDTLIDSEKDVTLLRQNGIIRHTLGENKEVADIFNKIRHGVTTSRRNLYYKEECRKATQHCGKTWNKMMANLRRNYFNTPWAGAATVAAIILLFLTVTQTVLAFISVPK